MQAVALLNASWVRMLPICHAQHYLRTTALGMPQGSVYFVKENNGVRIIGRFVGINGTHGLHIHTVLASLRMMH